MIYYLAYGSNMVETRLRRRVLSAEKLGLVSLPGHRLTFDNASAMDGSAKCNALPTGDRADLVIAVLYRILLAEKPLLDYYVGLGIDRRDTYLPIRLPTGDPAEALIYYGTNPNPNLRPYHWYKEHVLRGAEENELPADYIAGIQAVQSIEDPDPARVARELAIYTEPKSENH